VYEKKVDDDEKCNQIASDIDHHAKLTMVVMFGG
jgi:hypothetical protein